MSRPRGFGSALLAVPRVDGFTNEFIGWASADGVFDGFHESLSDGPATETAAELLWHHNIEVVRGAVAAGMFGPITTPESVGGNYAATDQHGAVTTADTRAAAVVTAQPAAQSNLPWLVVIAVAVVMLMKK
jgi:hypothetical protein